jgi:hypothetical protein
LAAVHDGMAGSGTSDDPYVVTDDHELQAMNHELDAHYKLGKNIDASETENWNDGEGFEPIGKRPQYAGDPDQPFEGVFDGGGYEIKGLYMNPSDRDDPTGLFGANSGDIRNTIILGANITETEEHSVGVLAGVNSGGLIENSLVTGKVKGGDIVGGLVGDNFGGKVRDSSADVEVYAMGDTAGGLIGRNQDKLENSYSRGDVTGGEEIGGLVGSTTGGAISNSYATGGVEGNKSVGGLVGDNNGVVSESYWDTESSGQDSSDGGAGLTTSEMQGDSYNAGFESDIVDDSAFTGVTGDYPELPWESE